MTRDDRVSARHATVRIVAVAVLVVTTGGCRSLAKDPPKVASYADSPARDVALATVTGSLRTRGDDACGFLAIDSNRAALDWRLALVDSAERTLDLKYYIWRPHLSSTLLLDRMLAAADRGVRVRLLVDDMYLTDRDRGVALLDAHPRIEVRIYNPWRTREGGMPARAVEAVTRFDEINHRMHNKLLVADNHLAIIGGRNVGDEYFGLQETYNVRDFDLLVAGPVVPRLSRTFDDFWNSELSYPGDHLVRKLDRSARAETDAIIDEALAARGDRLEAFPLEPQDWTDEIAGLPARLHVGTARVVYDAAPDEVRDHEGRVGAEIV
jgi:putative cardiolipin synthase